MILEYKKYVSDEFVEEIRQQVAPFVGQQKQKTSQNRDGITVNITKTQELNNLDLKLSELFTNLFSNTVRQRFKPQFATGDSGYEYHLYSPKNVCHYHSDGEVDGLKIRFAVVIIFLSDNDDGELVFPAQNVEIRPEKGKVVVFPPYGIFSHYSKPSIKDREILMTWFIYDGIEVRTHAT